MIILVQLIGSYGDSPRSAMKIVSSKGVDNEMSEVTCLFFVDSGTGLARLGRTDKGSRLV